MKIEIAILLGLNCNFNCSHCLNDSRPGYKDFDLKRSESDKIICEIENNEAVDAVSFSGGEPLLYIDEIQYVVNELRRKITNRSIHFSITTNGALVQQTAVQLKILKLDTIIISYDNPHSSFLESQKLAEAIDLAKTLFGRVELATTFQSIATESPIADVAMKQNVKVNFNKMIHSGRFTSSLTANNTSTYNNIVCPNLDSSATARLKITYLGQLGFTTCCGPLLFDNIKASADICFPSVEALLHSRYFLLQKKLTETKVKCTSSIDCETCASTLRDPVFNKFSNLLLNPSVWDNTVPLAEHTSSELKRAEDFFRLRRIGFSTPASFENIPDVAVSSSQIVASDSGSKLTIGEIKEISDFIVDSFYRVHVNLFTEKDIEIFQSQLPTFFSLPFHFVRHRLKGKIVGVLLVALLDNHPFYKKSVWHIGYWGIDKCVEDRMVRQSIKNEWQKLLKELSSLNQVSVIIDQFNTPALKMTESFGMDITTLRLDPRIT